MFTPMPLSAPSMKGGPFPRAWKARQRSCPWLSIQIPRRGAKAKPPRHRRAARRTGGAPLFRGSPPARRHVDLVRPGAPFGGSADLAGIKRCRSTVGSTHHGPSMALGVSPPSKVLSHAVQDRCGQGRKDSKDCQDGLRVRFHVEVSVLNSFDTPLITSRAQSAALFPRHS